MMETLPFGSPYALLSAIVSLLVEIERVVGLWVITAFGAAVISGFMAAYQKRLTGPYTDQEVSYVTSTYALLLLVPVGLWSFVSRGGLPDPSLVVIVAAAVSGVFNVIAVLLRVKAFDVGDLSVVGPLASLTPISVALIEPFALGVAFDPLILVAALVAVGGVAVIVVDDDNLSGLAGRVTTLGPLLALGASGAYTVTTLADKFAVSAMPPFQYALALHLMMAVGTWAVLYNSGSSLAVDRSQYFNPQFVLLGLLRAGTLALIFTAYSLTVSAAQVAIVLQFALIINVFLGGLAFEEDDTLRRGIGTALIVAGVGVAV